MIRDTSLSDTVVVSSSRFRRKHLIVGAALVGLLLVGAYSVASPWLRAERTVSSDRLRIATVARGPFERSISVQGTVDAVIRPTLYGLSDGTIKLHVRAGDLVKAKQLLAEIDNPELQNQLRQERSRMLQIDNELARQRLSTRQSKVASEEELALLEIDLTAAQRELERIKDAVRREIMREMDRAIANDSLAAAETRLQHRRARVLLEKERLDFELASKALEVDRQRLAVAELDRRVEELRVLSPNDGLVGNVLVQDRDSVTLNQPLMTVVNLSEFEVRVTIPETYADDLAPNMHAVISVQGRQLEGTLASVSPEVTNGHVEGRITLDPGATSVLKQKQRLTVKIVLDSKADALTVPRGPFLEDGAGRVAYVVDDSLATLRPITTGAVGVSQIEIVDGLAEGDQIIISSISGFEQAKTVLIR
jgi:HlyD family secretion protein